MLINHDLFSFYSQKSRPLRFYTQLLLIEKIKYWSLYTKPDFPLFFFFLIIASRDAPALQLLHVFGICRLALKGLSPCTALCSKV